MFAKHLSYNRWPRQFFKNLIVILLFTEQTLVSYSGL